MGEWKETIPGRRWDRSDGAAVKEDYTSPHPNPDNPRSLLWTAWEPDPSEKYLAKSNGRPRRFNSAANAMRAVDRAFPICPWCKAGNEPNEAGDHWIVKSIIPAKIDIRKCRALTSGE
jgi:hypothetical protein